MNEMMACGHAANAVSNGKPVCVICSGLSNAAETVVETPNLEGRMAVCSYARNGKPHTGGSRQRFVGAPAPVPSSTNLPFFKRVPDGEFDEYYCGCWGWD